MNKQSCILIDDERLARVELRAMLAAYPWVTILAEAAHVDEALPLIEQHQPDFLFLDIQMPEKTGFDLLEELSYSPEVVFTTAYDQYAIKAFEVNALDYLLKPIREERLSACLTKIKNKLEERKKEVVKLMDKKYPHQIFARDRDQCFFVKTKEVSLFASYGNYVRLFFNSQSVMIKKSLNAVEERLNPELFFRVNRTEIINLSMITNIQQEAKGKLRIQLSSGKEVEVSERKSVLFKERMSF